MLVQDNPPLHLTYCLNIHAGEAWPENLEAVRRHALRVRDKVCPGGAFGLGLRLGEKAAGQLNIPGETDAFREFLTAENLYVFTINGFPYGEFHGRPVKQDVYSPDWRQPQRRDYTLALAEILAQLLPEGVTGSVSTVPVSYKPWIKEDVELTAAVANLADTAEALARLHEHTGREIILALEPEPDCIIETTAEAVDFVAGRLRAEGGRRLQDIHGRGDDAQEIIRRHVGICMDTAHHAVQFEDPADVLGRLNEADIRVGKIQLSAALETNDPENLKAFGDEVYLHQVRVKCADGRIIGYPDLPEALDDIEAGRAPQGVWRVHYHVPLFWPGGENLTSTAGSLAGEFAEKIRRGACRQLEIETYTFDVLPEELKAADVTDSIAGEYRWVMEHLLK